MKKSIYTNYDELPLLLSVKQLVDLMGVSDSTIYELIQEDDFGLLEKNLSALSFNHAVELDMLVGIISDITQLDREDLKRRRAQSVKNIKHTNGRISLEKRAQQRDEYEMDEEEASN